MSKIYLEPEIEARLIGNGKTAFEKINRNAQQDIVSFLEDNPRETIHGPNELMEAYLCWNGIIGYTSNIVETVRQAFGE
jgi:hypothetical protein